MGKVLSRPLRRFASEGRLYVCNHIVSSLPSHTLRLAFYRRIMGAVIGRGSSIHLGAHLDATGGLHLGENSTVNHSCRLDTRGGITIGRSVSISADVSILTADHDVQSSSFHGRQSAVSIGDYVFIGTRALVLPGITIGTGAVVAAGSVVTRDVPAYSIVAGSPARQIGVRSSSLDYHVRYARLFH